MRERLQMSFRLMKSAELNLASSIAFSPHISSIELLRLFFLLALRRLLVFSLILECFLGSCLG